MKFSILNTLKMGISIFTLASAAYVQGVHNAGACNLGEQNFQAGIGVIPHWAKEKLEKEDFLTRSIIQSINDWQFNAIYLKAGIETLAKETSGNEFTVVSRNLSQNASTINNFVYGKPNKCEFDKSFGDLDFLITRQNALLFDYTVAYIDQDHKLIEFLNRGLIETNNEIYLFLLNHLFDKNADLPIPDLLQVALEGYLDSLLIEIQTFVEAINFETGHFKHAYEAYRVSLDFAEEVGRIIGEAVVHKD